MAMPDYCRTLLKKSNSSMTCVCIHRNTRTEFGGWSNCANPTLPLGRDHTVRNNHSHALDGNKYEYLTQSGGSQQKSNAKPGPKLSVFRNKKDKKGEEPECLRFCHLDNSGDHVRQYRERKNGMYVEKIPNKMGPPFRLLQLKGDLQHDCFHDLEDGINNGNRLDNSRVQKMSNFLPLIIYNSNSSDNESEMHILSQQSAQLLRLEAQSTKVPGKALLFYSDIDSLGRGHSKGYREGSSVSGTQYQVCDQALDFATWVPENAIYQTRQSSATMYNSMGCLTANKLVDSQASSSFQPLHLHTSHLKKSKYPPPLIVRDKQQDDLVTVKNLRRKDGKLRTKVEYLTMTTSEKKSGVIKKRVRYLDPLPMDEEVTSNRCSKDVDHHYWDDGDNSQSGRLYSGRLLYGRMKSGTQKVTEEDLQRLAIGSANQRKRMDDKQTEVLSKSGGNVKTRKKLYHVEKQDSTQSIPSKSTARANNCDLQILPSPESSAAVLHRNSNSDTNVSSTRAQVNGAGDIKLGDVLLKDGSYTEDGRAANFMVEFCDRESENVIVNCPTVIDSTLLATPHRSNKNNGEEKVISTGANKKRHSYPNLRKSTDLRSSLYQHNHQTTNSQRKLAAGQLNQVLLNTCTDKLLPSSNLHGRNKFSQALVEQRGSVNSATGYRVTLGSNSSTEIHHHQASDSNRCVLRSRQRRRAQLQKNILGNPGRTNKLDRNSTAVPRRGGQPVRVCLRGRKKMLTDYLRTNSSNSIDNSCDLSELYAE